jgi:hypothetical protein
MNSALDQSLAKSILEAVSSAKPDGIVLGTLTVDRAPRIFERSVGIWRD